METTNETINNHLTKSFDSFDSGSDSSSEKDENEELGSNNAPIMSIFASYYGIEDPNSNTPQEARGTIDDSNFNSELFVKNLLKKEPLEVLVAKDAELVHDIRTLDGEMQKLVYDNYNKFITATETIKEMKTDVFAMDEDMNSVRTKMSHIVTSSESLDQIFEYKRNQVDKLVRVRRLLNRLEFLSELPERLAAMIDHKLYKDAVQLYNKTISVLTRHSHVLSFKKIKERTEVMMADLTEKVIDLLDDVTLEANKLTQYVNILRLMNAPSEKVSKKFINSHMHRSVRMINQFKANNSLDNSKDINIFQKAELIPLTRTYHQSIIVGMIEACKGINELYSAIGVDDKIPKDKLFEEVSTTFKELYELVIFIIKDHTVCLKQSFHNFFQVYQMNQTLSACDFESINTEDTTNENTNIDFLSEFSNLKISFKENKGQQASNPSDSKDSSIQFSLQEQHESWLLLARQVILDVTYLEKSVKDCHDFIFLQKLKVNSSEMPSYSFNFAESFVSEITQEIVSHNLFIRNLFIDQYVKNISNYWVPMITFLFQSVESKANILAKPSRFDYPNLLVKGFYQLIHNQIKETFSEYLRFIKPLLEIYELISLELLYFSNDLVLNFVEELTNRIIQENKITFYDQNPHSPAGDGTHDDYYEISKNDLQYTITIEDSNNYSIRASELFIFFSILKYLSDSLVQVFSDEIECHHFPILQLQDSFESSCHHQLDFAQKLLIKIFLEENISFVSNILTDCHSELYSSFYTSVISTIGSQIKKDNTKLSITSNIISLLQYFDKFSSLVYILFLQQPPIYSRPERENLRRSSVARNINTSNTGTVLSNQSLSLQMDIERLFTQKIKIIDIVPSTNNAEYLIKTLIKSSLKADQELIRNMIFSYESYIQYQIDINMIKQAATFLLKDVADIDNLIDQLLTTVFSQYIGANDISNANDNSETGLINKLASEGINLLVDKSILISRGK